MVLGVVSWASIVVDTVVVSGGNGAGEVVVAVLVLVVTTDHVGGRKAKPNRLVMAAALF